MSDFERTAQNLAETVLVLTRENQELRTAIREWAAAEDAWAARDDTSDTDALIDALVAASRALGRKVVARDEVASDALRSAVTAFVDKHFRAGSKNNRHDYVVLVPTADVHALVKALRLAGGGGARMTIDLDAIKQRRDAAFQWVFDRAKGTARFVMSIPYQDTDTDAILCNALEDSENLEKETTELRAENERLRADLFEYVLDGFVQGAHRQEDGGYNTGGISTYRDLGDWLVEHAGWTRRDGGSGRIQVYDPPALEAEAGQ